MLLDALIDLCDALFPARCPLCAAPAADALGCDAHRLPASDRSDARLACPRCAATISAHLALPTLCADCRGSPPGFRGLLCLAGYHEAPAVREWILALKHGGRRDLARPLGQLLGGRLRGHLRGSRDVDPSRSLADREPGLLVPVPLHRLRRWERGHDQAHLLAAACAQSTGIPLLRALARTRRTVAQGSPGAVSRRANVAGAFRLRHHVRRRLADETVWLVDDVVTSCATVAECARVLRRGGARRVNVLCVARASAVGARQGERVPG